MSDVFKGRFSQDGGLHFSDFYRNKLKFFMRKNPGMPFELVPLLPESRKMRNWFEGAVVPLITFYQEGLDHRNNTDLKKVHEWIKLEFNGEIVKIGGKTMKVPQSTKGQLTKGGVAERVIGWLEDNYQPPQEALNPNSYKYWRDVLYGEGGPDTFIDYLIEKGILK